MIKYLRKWFRNWAIVSGNVSSFGVNVCSSSNKERPGKHFRNSRNDSVKWLRFWIHNIRRNFVQCSGGGLPVPLSPCTYHVQSNARNQVTYGTWIAYNGVPYPVSPPPPPRAAPHPAHVSSSDRKIVQKIVQIVFWEIFESFKLIISWINLFWKKELLAANV